MTPESHGVQAGQNPDFPGGVDSNGFTYNAGVGGSKFTEIGNQSDLPSIFGPNLVAPDINSPSSASTSQEKSPTAKKNAGEQPDDANNPPEGNGYGTEIITNDPRYVAKINGPFFSTRTGDQRQTLGEFFLTNTYDYDESDSL